MSTMIRKQREGGGAADDLSVVSRLALVIEDPHAVDQPRLCGLLLDGRAEVIWGSTLCLRVTGILSAADS